MNEKTEDNWNFMVGAAKVSITPDESFFPVDIMNEILIGVYSEIFVRVILVSSKGNIIAIVAFDLGSTPRRKTLRTIIANELGIQEENVFLTATHNHSAPFIPDEVDTGFMPFPKSAKMDVFADLCQEACMKAVKEASANMKPARYGFGTGNSYINVNRDFCYEDGYDEGTNPAGPTDRTVALVRFEDHHGNPIAFWINYAVHAVGECMAGRESNNARLSGDLPGITSAYIEQRFGNSVVALWTSGAAGDQNPVTRNFYPVYALDGTHIWDQVGEEIRGYIRSIGVRHAIDTLKVNERIIAHNDAASISVGMKSILLPGQKPVLPEFASVATPGATINRKWDMVDSEPVEVRLQMLRLGDELFYFTSGEVVTSIGQMIKAVSPLPNTVVVTLSDGHSGYMPDDFGYENKTFEYNLSRIRRGYCEKALLDEFREMLACLD